MSQTYNYIEFNGNAAVGSVMSKIVDMSNEYRENFPALYSKQFIANVFFGMSYAEFQKADIDLVTKYLHTDVIGPNEIVCISGSVLADSFQDYLTQKLATVDPNVLLINSFNNSDDESGEYFTTCKDAVNGDYSICYAFINSESDSSKTRKTKLKELANQIPWKCESLEAIIKL